MLVLVLVLVSVRILVLVPLLVLVLVLVLVRQVQVKWQKGFCWANNLKEPIVVTLHDIDRDAWSTEQARLLRGLHWSTREIDTIAAQLDSAGWTELRELGKQFSTLIADLLTWRFQPALRTRTLVRRIQAGRRQIARDIAIAPSLRQAIYDSAFLTQVWNDAFLLIDGDASADSADSADSEENDYPTAFVWPLEEVLDPQKLPE